MRPLIEPGAIPEKFKDESPVGTTGSYLAVDLRKLPIEVFAIPIR